jgi:hypothetical protein
VLLQPFISVIKFNGAARNISQIMAVGLILTAYGESLSSPPMTEDELVKLRPCDAVDITHV